MTGIRILQSLPNSEGRSWAELTGNLPPPPPDVPRPRSKAPCLGSSPYSLGSPSTRSKTTSSPTFWAASAVEPSRCHKVRVSPQPGLFPFQPLPSVTSLTHPCPPPRPSLSLSSAGMAFALLANLPAVNGLYSSFFPLLTYFFLGGIHQMVPGKASPLSAGR